MLSLIPGCQHRRLLGLSYEEEFTQYALHLLAGMTFFHSITLDLFFDRSMYSQSSSDYVEYTVE